MPIALLPDRTVVAVSGSDALPFLQGILTCNVETLPEGEARLGALLTPQGKIQFDFLVSRSDDGFRLDVAAERVADLVKRLGLYRLRAKVTVAADPTLGVAAAWDGAETAAETVRVRDGRIVGDSETDAAEALSPASSAPRSAAAWPAPASAPAPAPAPTSTPAPAPAPAAAPTPTSTSTSTSTSTEANR